LAAYGAADGTRPQLVSELRQVLDGLLSVDLTVVLDVCGDTAFERLATTERRNRFELRGREYLNSVALAYRALAEREKRTAVVDASATPANVCEQLREILTSSFAEFERLSFTGVSSDSDPAQLDLNL